MKTLPNFPNIYLCSLKPAFNKKLSLLLFLTFSLTFNIHSQSNFYRVPVKTKDCNNNILPNVKVWLNQVPTPASKAFLPGLYNYYTVSDSNGIAVFDTVYGATYKLKAYKYGHDSAVTTVFIHNSDTITVNLFPIAYPPRDFKVNPLTSVATWQRPMKEVFPFEDFEDTLFPPAGWQTMEGEFGGCSWYRTDDASYVGFPVPPGDGFYAFSDNFRCDSYALCNSYLITPSFDLRELDSINLSYRSYYTGDNNVVATVEYSTDSGNTWYVIDTAPVGTEWIYDTIDLTPFHGIPGDSVFYLAFHANDIGYSGLVWGIDNVSINEGESDALGYYIFLDNKLLNALPPDCTSYYYDSLIFGQNYTGELSAFYSCNVSNRVSYYWTSSFLYPPQNFGTQYTVNSDEVLAFWNPPAIVETDSAVNLLAFNVYIDDDVAKQVPYEGQGVNEQISTILDFVPIGEHTFKASALYDLSDYGFPGDTGESMFTSVDTNNLVYGFHLPFYEYWDVPDFENNNWTVVSEHGISRWVIDRNEGNPKPSVALEKDTTNTDYQTTLVSYPINALDISDGDIFIDFAVKAETNVANSKYTEYLYLEVYDYSDNYWHYYFGTDLVNSTDFEKHTVKISDNSIGKIFRFRFRAWGSAYLPNSRWIVDNIKVYRKCKAPQDLTGTYVWYPDTLGGNESFGALISWKAEGFVSNSKFTEGKNRRSMQYFNVYRKTDSQSEYELYGTVPFDTATTEYWFYDAYPNVTTGEGYFYKVTAVWEDENICESPAANALAYPYNNYIYIFITGTGKRKAETFDVLVFPNPAKDILTVKSKYPIKDLYLLSGSGRTLLHKSCNKTNRCIINVSGLKHGVYSIVINSSKGVFVKRFVAQ